ALSTIHRDNGSRRLAHRSSSLGVRVQVAGSPRAGSDGDGVETTGRDNAAVVLLVVDAPSVRDQLLSDRAHLLVVAVEPPARGCIKRGGVVPACFTSKHDLNEQVLRQSIDE